MSRTYIRQDAQIRRSVTYTDTTAPSVNMETASVNVEDDLNNVRSQLKRWLAYTDVANWYDDVPTVTVATVATTRGIKQIHQHLAELEQHRFLFRAYVLTDVTVPADVDATGSLTALAKASLSDGDLFTLDDGINALCTYYFNVTGGYAPGGGYDATNIEVDISADVTDINVADTTRTAITGTAAMDISPDAAGAALINLTADNGGTVANNTITETLAAGTLTPVGMSGGTGDVVVLSVAGSEAPSETAAVDGGIANGVVVKTLTGDVGQADLAEVAGANAINPKNLVVIVDAATQDPLQTADNRTIYGLIQTENGVADGDTFNDVDHQVQLSFVVVNGPGDDLEFCAASDIGGQDIEYGYVRRLNLDDIPEQAFLVGGFIDLAGAVDVTLDNAIDNQVGPATQQQNIDWRIDDTFTLDFQDSTGATNLLSIIPNAAGDEVEFNVDDFDVNNVNDADFLNGATFDSGGTAINIGVTAGQIDAAAELTIATTGVNDLNLLGGAYLTFSDTYQAASGYDTDLVLSDSSAEWDAYETAFGEVSLLNAIVAASQAGGHHKAYAVVTAATIAADANVTGAGTAPNIDAQLLDYSAITWLTDVNIYLNGVLLRNGADAAANHDVYPGTTPANGDLKFEFLLQGAGGNPDVITMEIFSAGL